MSTLGIKSDQGTKEHLPNIAMLFSKCLCCMGIKDVWDRYMYRGQFLCGLGLEWPVSKYLLNKLIVLFVEAQLTSNFTSTQLHLGLSMRPRLEGTEAQKL